MTFGLRIIAAALALFAQGTFACAEEPVQAPQLRIEAGMHTAVSKRLDVSADGQLLVTGSEDKTVRLWSLPTGKLVKTFRVPIAPGPYGKIYAVAISPDGRLIAAGGWTAQPGSPDEYVYLFDTISGALAARLGPLPNAVNDLAFSPDGEELAAGLLRTNGVRLWSRPFAGKPRADTDYAADVYAVTFDPSGSGRLAASSYDGSIRLYEKGLALPPKRAKAPGGAKPFGIDFSRDGTRLALGYDDTPAIDIFAVPSLEKIGAMPTGFAERPYSNFSSVRWSLDGRSLYSAGRFSDFFRANPVARWNVEQKGPPDFLGGARDTILDLAPVKDGTAFMSGEPSFGVLGDDKASITHQEPVIADMRGKTGAFFAAKGDASAVWFGLNYAANAGWRFDLNDLSFRQSLLPLDGDVIPRTDGLPVTGWDSEANTSLDGKPLPFQPYETARSLAIAPDAESFVIGTDWTIYRFDKDGGLIWKKGTEGPAWGVNLAGDGTIIVAAMGDGTIRWYRTSDGDELLAFFVHVPDKRWVAWTPSGYYAASPGGEDLIGWQVNGKSMDAPVDFFPASLFREKNYRPDIVQLVLKTQDEARAIAEANEIAKRKEEQARLPAVVEIIADPRGIATDRQDLALKYRLRSPSGRPVTRLELRVDGQLTQARAMEAIDESLSLDEELTMSVPLPARDVTVSLTAYIENQPSAAATLAVKWTGATQAGPKPKLYALLVGVSNYDEPKLRLNYAAKDAADMEAALMRQKGKFFSDVETVLLLDDKADEDDIEIALSRLRKKVGPDDYAVVFMAGHGVTDAQGGFHFLPANASLEEDELQARSLNGLIIRDMLRTMQGKVLFFMDACNAGNGIGGDQALADMTGFANEFAQSNGVVMYASSTGRQFSYENAEWGNGAFTKALIATLDDAEAFGKDGKLSIFELAEELSGRVDALTGGLQTPVMTKSAAIPNFHLAAAN